MANRLSKVHMKNAIYQNCKGAMTESSVLTELLTLSIKPYFWQSGNKAELDFRFDNEGEIIPIEAKANPHARAKSYLQFCKTFAPRRGFKSSLKNIGDNEVEETYTVSPSLHGLETQKIFGASKKCGLTLQVWNATRRRPGVCPLASLLLYPLYRL